MKIALTRMISGQEWLDEVTIYDIGILLLILCLVSFAVVAVWSSRSIGMRKTFTRLPGCGALDRALDRSEIVLATAAPRFWAR